MSAAAQVVVQQPSKLALLFSILTIAANTIGTVLGTPIGADIKIAGALVQIAQHAFAGYQAETGTPLDLSKIPAETPIL